MDRVAASEAVGRGFESLQVHFFCAVLLLSDHKFTLFPFKNIDLVRKNFIRCHELVVDLLDHRQKFMIDVLVFHRNQNHLMHAARYYINITSHFLRDHLQYAAVQDGRSTVYADTVR